MKSALSVRSIAAIVLSTGSLLGCGARAPAEDPSASPTTVVVGECPPGSQWDGTRCAGAALPSPGNADNPPAETTKEQPRRQQEDLARLVRGDARSAPRASALLRTELSGLESLFSSTPRAAPDRVVIARRLAQAYLELEEARTLEGSEADASAARDKAIQFLALIKDEYPSYAKLDEVLYYLAYEYEQQGDMNNARRTYFEVIQKAPSSRYIPNAYLAFGEMFFKEAATAPNKLELAKQAYSEVIKYPPPDNRAYGYACYKLGWVYHQQGGNDPINYSKALGEFKRAIEFGVGFGSLPGAAALVTAARKDLVHTYSFAGKPDQAWNFFRPLSGDGGTSSAATARMALALGKDYVDGGHYAEAVSLYEDLVRRGGPEVCSALPGQVDTLIARAGVNPSYQSLQNKVGTSCKRP